MSDFLKIFREVQEQGRTGSLEQSVSPDSPSQSGLAVPEYDDPQEKAIIDSRMKNTGNRFLDMF